MKTIAVSTAFFAVAISGGVHADIAGLVQDAAMFYSLDGDDLQVTTFEDADYAVIDMYVDFSAPNTSGNLNSESYLLNMFRGNVAVSGFESFVQFDASPAGSWKPLFSLDLPSVGAYSQIDSFVTINSGVGADAAFNSTTLDPGFGDGLNDDIFNTDIGWYQVPPGDGGVMADLKVWVGRFVVTGEEARNGAEFSMSSTVGYDYQNGSAPFYGEVTSDFTFIPTPGVLAAMGLGTLCLRHRQR
jgi:hypothetical protein